MELPRELAESALDLRFARAARDAQYLVIVAFRRRHYPKGTREDGLRLLVDVLREARELERGRAHRADRLLVVHAQRPEQADRAERAIGEPIGGADVGDVVELPAVDLRAHPDDRLSRVERVAQQLEHGSPALEQLEQALGGLDPVGAGGAE